MRCQLWLGRGCLLGYASCLSGMGWAGSAQRNGVGCTEGRYRVLRGLVQGAQRNSVTAVARYRVLAGRRGACGLWMAPLAPCTHALPCRPDESTLEEEVTCTQGTAEGVMLPAPCAHCLQPIRHHGGSDWNPRHPGPWQPHGVWRDLQGAGPA